ncbi:O-antigen ligase family protein [Microbacterium betulae]|uniref:O-antigen ligase family protein n=1 Tax=Microbacterium betulae TaxID=2981139 RepID=A0AA97FLD8_9MICO|nr:O-antigen ligase family protein [Microbacterium sp. AB]WOF24189.1 O-antigen ligase family protein [Microbacterium sp. AB]
MAQLSRYPVAEPPTAPEREKTGHLLLRAYAVLVVFSALAHSFWYNLIGLAGAAVLLGVITLATLAIWIPRLASSRRAERFPWRRLPWVTLGYVAFAALSIAWSAWPAVSVVTWLLLASVTLQGLFLADVLTWRELVRCLEIALRWVVGLSVALELWVSAVLRHPLLPNFSEAPEDPDPHWYWVRGNLLDGLLGGGRLQGAVGNSNLLGILCLLALVVFALRLADRAPSPAMRWIWTVVAAYLFVRAGSATALVAVVAVVGVLAAAVLMRRAERPDERSRLYALFTAIAAAGIVLVLVARDRLLELVGREGDLTGREGIWGAVFERAIERPVAGNGFASPWLPWDPAFDRWIVDHGITVFHAHNMWLDVFLQLGGVGVVLVAGAFAALVWRSWFFAVDRPRWDIRADRPYQAVALLPTLVVTMLLVQGLTESGPIMLWGWLLVTMLAFKIKSAPLVDVGAAEASAPERRAPRSRRR